ncbi:hypothetical protein [Pantoea sp.]|uniref:hypothetical protein n=1 Tax=Pantoea sp. TaxID=69393 RepID=UPI0028978BAD|nr:hypothetical protein [Pantoea sp.]
MEEVGEVFNVGGAMVTVNQICDGCINIKVCCCNKEDTPDVTIPPPQTWAPEMTPEHTPESTLP